LYGEADANCTATVGDDYECECPAGYPQTQAHFTHAASELSPALRHLCEATGTPTDAPTSAPTRATEIQTTKKEVSSDNTADVPEESTDATRDTTVLTALVVVMAVALLLMAVVLAVFVKRVQRIQQTVLLGQADAGASSATSTSAAVPGWLRASIDEQRGKSRAPGSEPTDSLTKERGWTVFSEASGGLAAGSNPMHAQLDEKQGQQDADEAGDGGAAESRVRGWTVATNDSGSDPDVVPTIANPMLSPPGDATKEEEGGR
jgi:hypothetical protein